MVISASIRQDDHAPMPDRNQQRALFEGLFPQTVQVAFDTDLQSSDGGGPLLGAVDRRLGLTAALAACFADPRKPDKIRHSFLELFRQGIYSRALGYADGNDARRSAAIRSCKGMSVPV